MIRRILEFIRALLGIRPQLTLEAELEAKANVNQENLDWRNSIVDLMKLQGMDSSLDNRKKLAMKMGYPGRADGSAAMNTWLHKRLMDKMR